MNQNVGRLMDAHAALRFPSPCGVLGVNRGQGEDTTAAQLRPLVFPSPCGVLGVNLLGALIEGSRLFYEFPSPCGVLGVNPSFLRRHVIVHLQCLPFPSPCGVLGVNQDDA